jgi:hypothetical protein
VILRPKSPNHSYQFWGPNQETVTAGFEAKPPEIVAAGFEVKPLETVITGFVVKSAKTVRVVLRPNHSQTVAIGFEAQIDEKPCEWF